MMERSEAMKQLGGIFATMLTADDTVEINESVAACSRVLDAWLPGAKATCLVDDATGRFAGPVIHVSADHERALLGSQPYLYASVAVVHQADGLMHIVKNRYGYGQGCRINDLQRLTWLEGRSYSFRDSL